MMVPEWQGWGPLWVENSKPAGRRPFRVFCEVFFVQLDPSHASSVQTRAGRISSTARAPSFVSQAAPFEPRAPASENRTRLSDSRIAKAPRI